MNKTAIKNFAISARILLINAVTQIAFEYEVTEDGKNDPAQESVNGRTLTATEKSQRAQLISNIRLNGFTQTMEEAAYTWFNRFIALRYMEVNNYLPSHTRIFSDESGVFKPEVLDTAATLSITKKVNDVEVEQLDKELVLEMLENQENERLYKYIIIAQCNALNDGLPEMFEQIGGWTELLFPRNLLREDSVIAKMVTEIPEEDWRDQVQIIGWLYQYYNTEPKDKVFADLKKNIKISAAAIPAATQLFTPDWIVRYMVENSLGRLWAEGHGKPADADWKYYLEEAEQEDSVKAELAKIREEYRNIQPEQIKVIDPCMGSGHILVYAFDVLMQIYVSCGWSERDAAKSILRHNLYGLDIDRRAYQLAYFAVMMKARQYNRRILDAENQPNLANFADVMGVDTSMLEGKIREFAEQFAYADTYGSLMEVTAPDGLDEEVSEFNVSFGMSRRQLDMMMKICNILGQKYDVVCTNPPYMGGSGMNARLSDFVKNNFADYKSDLFSAFMVKIFDWCKRNGQIGLVTPYVWMFIQSYEKLRQLVYASMSITSMIQLEYNAFESACVPVATFTLCKSEIKTSGEYIKLSDFKGIENQEPKALEAINNPKCGYRYTAKQENFSKIPGMPVAYWVSKTMISHFCNDKKLINVSKPMAGLSTADNDRFLRFWFEVNLYNIDYSCKSKDDISSSIKKWFPMTKGGNYRKWYGSNEYLLNFENDGSELKYWLTHNPNDPSTTSYSRYIRNYSMYGLSGFSFNDVSSEQTSFRFQPYGFIPNSRGPFIYSDDKALLSLLNSKITKVMLNLIAPTLTFNVGDVAKMPIILPTDSNTLEITNDYVEENIELSKTDWDSFETSWDFEQHPLI